MTLIIPPDRWPNSKLSVCVVRTDELSHEHRSGDSRDAPTHKALSDQQISDWFYWFLLMILRSF